MSMEKELEALEQNHTWTLYELPTRKSLVGCAWKFKLNLNLDGTMDKPKLRLVAYGFTQVEGVDFHDYFSLVVKWTIIRTLVHLIVTCNWFLHHIDANNAFLHGLLHEEIYMRPGIHEGTSWPSVHTK